jgi:hypothetical protein
MACDEVKPLSTCENEVTAPPSASALSSALAISVPVIGAPRQILKSISTLEVEVPVTIQQALYLKITFSPGLTFTTMEPYRYRSLSNRDTRGARGPITLAWVSASTVSAVKTKVTG